MKRNLLKMLTLAIAIFSICGRVSAQSGKEIGLVSGALEWTNVTDATYNAGWQCDAWEGVTLSLYQGTCSRSVNQPKAYMGQNGNMVLVIDAGSQNMTTITLDYTSGSGFSHGLTPDVGEVTVDEATRTTTWTGNASKVTFTADYAENLYNKYERIFVYTDGAKPTVIPDLKNTAATAYTVTEARELLTKYKKTNEKVYIKGKISYVDRYLPDYGSITYYITETGDPSEPAFMIYSGKNLDNTKFSGKNDLQVGDEVTVYGELRYYGKDLELYQNNYIVKYRSVNDIPLADGEYFFRNVATKRYLAPAGASGIQLSLKTNGDLFKITQVAEDTYTLEDAYYVAAGNSVTIASATAATPQFNINGATATKFGITKATSKDIADFDKAVFSADKNYYWITFETDDARFYLTGSDGAVSGDKRGKAESTAWEILTREQIIKILEKEASQENPLNATMLIKDPDFSVNLSDKGANKSHWTIAAGNWNINGNANNFCAESWQSTFSYTQTMTDVPNGTYKLSAQAIFANYQGIGSDLYPVVFAQNGRGDESSIPFLMSKNQNSMDDAESTMSAMSTSFSNGKYRTDPFEIEVYDHTLTVGFKMNNNQTWCIFDNITMEYLGLNPEALNKMKAEINNLKTEAAAIIDKPMNTIVKNQLNEVLTNDGPAAETFDAYSEYHSRLSEKKKAADNSVAQYELVNQKNIKAQNFDAKSLEYYNEHVKKLYDEGTIVNASDIEADYLTALKLQTKDNIDLTEVIINPSFETNNFTGWVNENNFMQTQGNKAFSGTSGNIYAERWHVDGAYNIHQTITGLAPGKYAIIANIGSDNLTTEFYANDDVLKVASTNAFRVETNVTTGVITFGIRGTLTTSTWICIDNVQLKRVGGVDLTTYYAAIEKSTHTASELLGSNGGITAPMHYKVLGNLRDAEEKGKDVIANKDNYKDMDLLVEINDQINKAVEEAKASIEVYDGINKYIQQAKGLKEGGYDEFESIVKNVINAYTNGTITDGTSELQAVQNAIVPAIKAQKAENSDMTAAIENSDCTNGMEFNAAGWNSSVYPYQTPRGWAMYDVLPDGLYKLQDESFHVNNWSVEADPGVAYPDGSAMTAPFAELYNFTRSAHPHIRIAHDTETGYRPGTYNIKIYVRMRESSNNDDPVGFSFYANEKTSMSKYEHGEPDGKSVVAFYSWYEVDFVVDEDGVIDFGFDLNNWNFNWLAFKMINLTYKNDHYTDEQIEAILADIPEGKMNADVQKQLDEAKEAFETTPSIQNGKNLGTASSKAIESINLYKEILASFDIYAGKIANLDVACQTYYGQRIDDVRNSYNNGTLTSNGVQELYRESLKTLSNADFTDDFIINPYFEFGMSDWSGWTKEKSDASQRDYMLADNGNFHYVCDKNPSNIFVERWMPNVLLSNGSVSQTLNGMPDGKYTLSADLHLEWQGAGTGEYPIGGFYLFANEAMTEVTDISPSDVEPALGNVSGTFSVDVVVEGGKLTFGVKNQECGGNWVCMDNFHLIYKGSENINDYLNQLNSLIANAEELLEQYMNAEIKTALAAEVEKAKTANSSNTFDEVKKYISDLENAIKPAQKSAKIYAGVNWYYLKAQTYDEYGKSAYDLYAKKVIDATKAGTFTDGEAELKAAKEAIVKATKKQKTEGADMTLAIQNPSFEEHLNSNGWTAETNFSGFQSNTINKDLLKNTDGEYYAYAYNSEGTRKFDMSQMVEGIPSGFYSIKFNTYSSDETDFVFKANQYEQKVEKGENEYELFFLLEENDLGVTLDLRGNLSSGNTIAMDNLVMIFQGPEVKLSLETRPMNAKDSLIQANADSLYKKKKGDLTRLQKLRDAIIAAKASADAYEWAMHCVDSAENYLRITNIYSQRALNYCQSYLNEIRSKYNARTLTNSEADDVMNHMIQISPIDGTPFYRFNEAGTWFTQDGVRKENAIPGRDPELMYNFPVLYYLHDAWRIDKGGKTNIYADDNFHTNTWSDEGNAEGSSGMTTPFIEYWTNAGKVLEKGKIHAKAINLEPGLYTASVFTRVMQEGNTDNTLDLHGIKFSAKTKAIETEKVDLGDTSIGRETIERSKWNTSRSVSGIFHVDSIIVRAKDDHTIDLSFDIEENCTISWFSFKFANVTKTRDLTWDEEDKPASDELKDSLRNLLAYGNSIEISFAECEKNKFTGEIEKKTASTYGNINEINSLKAANEYVAANGDKLIEEEVLKYITALQIKNWTLNVDNDTNAIYNPKFSIMTENVNAPLVGWTVKDNTVESPETGGAGAAAIFRDQRVSNFNNAADGQRFSTAAFLKFSYSNSDAASVNSEYVYGMAKGYEMPLLAKTPYFLEFYYGGFGQLSDERGEHFDVTIYDPNGKAIKTWTLPEEGKELTNLAEQIDSLDEETDEIISYYPNQPKHFKQTFVADLAGNYTFSIKNTDTDYSFNIVISNMELHREPKVEMKVNANAHYGTFIAPYPVELPINVSAYVVTDVKNWVEIPNPSNPEEIIRSRHLVCTSVVEKYLMFNPTTKKWVYVQDVVDMNKERYIPAMTPVVLKYTGRDNLQHICQCTTEEEYSSYLSYQNYIPETVEFGYLHGFLGGKSASGKEKTEMQVPDVPNAYVLQKHELESACFYIVNRESYIPSVPKYRCFLTLPDDKASGIATAGARAKSLIFSFDDEDFENAVFIDGTEGDDATVVGYYTIDGASQNGLKKGVNILKMSDGTTRKQYVK